MAESGTTLRFCSPFWTPERRWFFQFFVCILICLNNGACFCFGVFTPYMKQGAFHYSQSEINIVSTVGVIFSYCSLPTGFLYDHKGPMATLFVGTILNVLGWSGMFLLFVNMDAPILGTNVGVMCLFYGISQLSASFYETGSLLASLDAFACYQGRVILIQKTFMGLGSSVIVQIYVAFFEKHFTGIGPFFLFLLIYSLCVGVLGTLFVRLPTKKTQCLGLSVPDEDVIKSGGAETRLFKLPFNVGTAILFAFIVFVLAVTLLENFHSPSEANRALIGVVVILLCLSFAAMIFITPSYSVNCGGYDTQSTTTTIPTAPAAVPTATTNNDATVKTSTTNYAPPHNKEKTESGSMLLSRAQPSDNYPDENIRHQEVELNIPEGPDAAKEPETNASLEGDQHASGVQNFHSGDNLATESRTVQQGVHLNSKSLWYNLRHREMWLMWYVCLASWSSATLVSTNSSQIYEAMDFNGYSSTVNVVFVSIYGVASAMGRVSVGIAHPFLLSKRIPVPSFICIAPLLNVIGLPLFLAMPKNALAIPFFVVGLATGVSWGSTVLIIKSLFASNNCGKHYSILFTAGIVSPFIFNVGIFGPIYDYYSKQQGRWETRKCEGRSCIWIPLVVCAIANVIALPLAIYFVIRVSKRGGLL
ncbi:hypothetical protein TraAM80_10031 [Trypanosoma rangeli]|uniref:Nodulin-like domain-containing protein n=1 Tax=Trypanosoma rangeli TaxID=5698 RepID=A0A3R7N3S6_TRYRA|nr:uncharacterized protein TraAM80_10031 [Trypanosoma rangeli]RNE95969.1 hypothetical protein TraAM80_10031 [Trypanosoma rangeli]|eukprot:RNE95969.1 hypothetical protein TraAM80_10031 [Trypanosoma rangeli]